MRSKTSLFNKTVYLKEIKRFWPIWAGYLFLWFMLFTMTTADGLYDDKGEFREFVFEMGLYSGAYISFVMGAITAGAVFSFIYSPKTAGMAGSMPLTRENLFITHYTAGLTMIIVPDIIIAVLTAMTAKMVGVLNISDMLIWLLNVSLSGITFYSIAVFLAMLTGNILIFAPLYILVNFLAVIVETLVREIMSHFIFGIAVSNDYLTAFLSPLRKMREMDVKLTWENYTPVITTYKTEMLWIYAAVGIVLAVCALLIFRKRHMETATDVVAVKPLIPVFRWCAAIGSALVGNVIICTLFSIDNSVLICLFMLIFGFIGYFGAEMLSRKSFRVFDKWKGFAVFTVLTVAAVICLMFDVFGLEYRLPDTDRITKCTLTSTGDNWYVSAFEEDADIDDVKALNRLVVETKKDCPPSERWNPDERSCKLTFGYILKSGREVIREYSFVVDEKDIGQAGTVETVLTEILNRNNSYIKSGGKPIFGSFDVCEIDGEEYFEYYDIRDSEIERVYYEGVLLDLQAGNIGKIDPFERNGNRHNELTIWFSDGFGEDKPAVALKITEECKFTVSILKELGYYGKKELEL